MCTARALAAACANRPPLMELRKDPITRSWVVAGHGEPQIETAGACPFCPSAEEKGPVLLALPSEGPGQVRVVPHPKPLYRIEGHPERTAAGIYDRMQPVGAHEVVIESADHARSFAHMSDDEIARVMEAVALRIADLKRDRRFKYVSAFRNQGAAAGQEYDHPHWQLLATTFVPRRILYELRSAREWYKEHERCVFCDILRQEEKAKKRVVDSQGDYVAYCPFASRVPYETWIMGRPHNHQYEQPRPRADRRNMAALVGRTLRRLLQVAHSYHLVLHTAPNGLQKKGSLREYWKTIAADYHWHIEILPILTGRGKSYGLKETYFNDLLPETAAENLRALDARA
jgi:UDPglucose--hexose-1-phosphate uridylyltransferase